MSGESSSYEHQAGLLPLFAAAMALSYRRITERVEVDCRHTSGHCNTEKIGFGNSTRYSSRRVHPRPVMTPSVQVAPRANILPYSLI